MEPEPTTTHALPPERLPEKWREIAEHQNYTVEQAHREVSELKRMARAALEGEE